MATGEPSPSAFRLQQTSPLDTLVRRTSARRANTEAKPAPGSTSGASSPALRVNAKIPIPNPDYAPPSPILHGHFSRASNATASTYDNQSYLDFSDHIQEQDNDHYYDDESIYSFNDPAMRESWLSSGGQQQTNYASNYNTQHSSHGSGPPHPMPAVVVSAADNTAPDDLHSPARTPGKAPITAPINTNFHKPAGRMHQHPPAIPPEDQKRQVIERNRHHTPSPKYSPRHPSPLHAQNNGQSYFDQKPSALSPQTPTSRTLSPSPLLSPLTPGSSDNEGSVHSNPSHVTLPRRPPSLRQSTPTSLYSSYSYYPYDSATPSPTTPAHFQQQQKQVKSSRSREVLRESKLPLDRAQQSLQEGIQHHEANRLKESAACFEQSAVVDGGCGVGMLMWGLTLRHGWGVEKNEKAAFKWLRKAAESAVGDLEIAKGGGGLDVNAVQTELVLAIYEVGQCFFQGWGVSKDQKMAVSYYTVAARLGDMDAQHDLGFCLANGKGVKKDRKEAAKWYRAAVAQGASDIGLAWIHKEKFQD